MTKFDLMSADSLLSTTRAVRKRLDFGRSVENSLIIKCLEISQQAPTGSNRQGWRWIIITEKKKRKINDNGTKGLSTVFHLRSPSSCA